MTDVPESTINRQLHVSRRMLVSGVVLTAGVGALAAARLSLGGKDPDVESNAGITASPTAQEVTIIMPAATPLASGAVRDALLQSSYTAEGVAFDLVLVPPIFFESIKRPDQGMLVGADKYVVFLLAEHHYHEDTTHNGHFSLMPILKIDGKDVHVARKTIEISNDGHHRTTALVFEELPVAMLDELHTWEMILPQDANGERAVLIWTTPINVEFSPVDEG